MDLGECQIVALSVQFLCVTLMKKGKPMIVLIDAYNLIKMALGKSQIKDTERTRFIADLGRYAKRKKLAIVAVFDGGSSTWASRESAQGITVIYAGIKQSADDYIKEYLSGNKGKDLLLISSDRELASYASQLNVPSLGALEFYSLMQLANQTLEVNASNHVPGVVKTSDQEHPELDLLMEQDSAPSYKQEEKAPSRTKGLSKQLSKIERQLLDKIKKL